MEGSFVEMDRNGGGVLTHVKRQSMCILSILKFVCACVQLISLSFSPFRVSSKKQTLIRLCNLSSPGPVGIWCQK